MVKTTKCLVFHNANTVEPFLKLLLKSTRGMLLLYKVKKHFRQEETEIGHHFQIKGRDKLKKKKRQRRRKEEQKPILLTLFY